MLFRCSTQTKQTASALADECSIAGSVNGYTHSQVAMTINWADDQVRASCGHIPGKCASCHWLCQQLTRGSIFCCRTPTSWVGHKENTVRAHSPHEVHSVAACCIDFWVRLRVGGYGPLDVSCDSDDMGQGQCHNHSQGGQNCGCLHGSERTHGFFLRGA